MPLCLKFLLLVDDTYVYSYLYAFSGTPNNVFFGNYLTCETICIHVQSFIKIESFLLPASVFTNHETIRSHSHLCISLLSDPPDAPRIEG